ncbi:TPA: lysis system i-spanin subunit Rz [Proteus mirabilis]|uniref:lysis system i-spanin subunit Rz n=1 Tax=Proteus mirabilis TaxID=584 RepID=UPI001F0396C8|nr:lysis system i-spanin subunit Rz [Proteus mirabilis]EKU2371011.1 lysis protein [Proteus mirabilis]EKU7917371.1 lysis protein [Proteus mirabilis]EKU7921389.1 lysis protein [Proteus mirabilis]EKU8688611.1 lysis protein [Proteus mirabilis]EKU8703441.1 lysis protein [Proteus mirabilis]
MKYWKFYIVVVIVGIVAGGCALINAQAKRINTLTENNKELTTALEEQKDINTDYQVRIERLNQLDTRRTQELVNAKNEINRLRDISERNPERVYIKAECPKSTNNSTTSMDDATTARPTDTAIRNYWLLRERIAESEQVIKGLQDYVGSECLK